MLALLLAPAGGAQIPIAGYVFDSAAAPDVAIPVPGSHPEFAGPGTACAVAPTLAGLSLQQSVDTVFTDSLVTSWAFGRARARLDFTDNVVVNGAGADLVVFEIGGAEGFSLQVFVDALCTYSNAISYTPAATGFTVDPCGTMVNPINAKAIDLSDFGVLPGAAVQRLLIDNLGQPGGAVGADLAAVMALHSGPPQPFAECLLGYQQGIDSGAGLYSGAVDTAIGSDFPATQYGAAPLDYVDGSPKRDLLVRFDGLVGNAPGQLPAGSLVTRATLTVTTGDGTGGSAGVISLHRLLQPWNAATITWANSFGGNGVGPDDIEATATPVGSVPATGASTTRVIDVTPAVQAWADGAPNHGLVLLTTSTDGLGLHLAEASVDSLRPALTVQVAGKLGFAEAVADFSPTISSGQPSACLLVPSEALGPPDHVSGSGCCPSIIHYATLGVGGSITLEFTSISISGGGSPEPDLWIYEIGPDVEDTFVDLSADGSSWTSVGKVFGATSSIDLDALGIGPLSLFRYVRLTDDPAEGDLSGCSVGADIDAVAALSPNPWLSLGAGLPGINGTPKLAASGALDAGGPVTFSITGAKPNGSAYFVLGLAAINAPLKGGVLVPQPTVLVKGLPLGPTGSLLLPAAWPAGIPAGLNVFVQCWIPDAAGPSGFSATNAIKSVTQ
jgi:hypothetical protein